MIRVNSRTSCRQLCKEIKILMLAYIYIYILEVTCFIKRYCQSVELKSNIHESNTQRKMDIHV